MTKKKKRREIRLANTISTLRIYVWVFEKEFFLILSDELILDNLNISTILKLLT